MAANNQVIQNGFPCQPGIPLQCLPCCNPKQLFQPPSARGFMGHMYQGYNPGYQQHAQIASPWMPVIRLR